MCYRNDQVVNNNVLNERSRILVYSIDRAYLLLLYLLLLLLIYTNIAANMLIVYLIPRFDIHKYH